VKKYGTAKQTTDDNIMQHIYFECWITKATDTHSEYVILNGFSTAKMVTRTCLSVTLYVFCLCCLFTHPVKQNQANTLQHVMSVSSPELLNSSVKSILIQSTHSQPFPFGTRNKCRVWCAADQNLILWC
jgi:hypothetical protein